MVKLVPDRRQLGRGGKEGEPKAKQESMIMYLAKCLVEKNVSL